MDPQLQQQLAEYLKGILATAQSGAAFVQEQAPLVVQEKVLYGRVWETALLVIFIAAVMLSAWTVRRGYRYKPASYMDDTGTGMMAGGTVVGALCAIFSVVQLHMAAQVWFAPRLYILEWAMSLVKQ